VKKYRVEVWHEFEIEAENYDDAVYKAVDRLKDDVVTGALDFNVEEVEEEEESE